MIFQLENEQVIA